jgi:rubrerythrin
MEILKAIKLAIQMEQKAALFYSQAAKQTSDPQAKKILSKFSKDEIKHSQYLQNLVDNYYLKKNRYDIPDFTATEYTINKDGPIFGKSMKELADHPDPVKAAVKKFAMAEGEAIKLYKKLSGASKDPGIKRFFKKLAEWEERHLTLLKKQAEDFRKIREVAKDN